MQDRKLNEFGMQSLRSTQRLLHGHNHSTEPDDYPQPPLPLAKARRATKCPFEECPAHRWAAGGCPSPAEHQELAEMIQHDKDTYAEMKATHVFQVGDRLRINGTIYFSNRSLPFLASGLTAEVADITTDNYGTAICLHTGVPDMDTLGPWFGAEDVLLVTNGDRLDAAGAPLDRREQISHVLLAPRNMR